VSPGTGSCEREDGTHSLIFGRDSSCVTKAAILRAVECDYYFVNLACPLRSRVWSNEWAADNEVWGTA
jgi:hypothetical protein